MANVALNWVVPFFVLLPRPAKRNGTIMARVAAIVLIGRWLDLYLMVYPSRVGETPAWGVWEAAGIVLAVSVVARLIWSAVALAPSTVVGNAAPPGPAERESQTATA